MYTTYYIYVYFCFTLNSNTMDKNEKGKTVSRAVYQKLSEENKKLKADLKAMCFNEPSAITTIIKASWKMHFKKEADFNAMMKKYATNYIKEHPEYDITLKP